MPRMKLSKVMGFLNTVQFGNFYDLTTLRFSGFGITLTAEGFVLVRFAKHDLFVACHNAMTDIGECSTADADGMHLCYVVGDGTELGHWAEGLTFEVKVKTRNNHTYSAFCQFVADIDNLRVEELRLIDAEDIAIGTHK